MNEMKPEDVMRALECWTSHKPCDEDCPVLEYEGSQNCRALTIKNALALLREKDAEIERLKQENKDLHDNTDVIIEMVTIARAEAITEFAKKLKEVTNCGCLIAGSNYYIINDISIDQIVNEIMKGD